MTIEIEVFSAPGCGKCGKAKQVLKKIVDDWDTDAIRWREVDILEELDHAVQLGVLSTPAIAIDGKLIFTALPSEKKLRQTIERYLQEMAP
jgi:predicted DsbA family dithiol-disulfide isomerase